MPYNFSNVGYCQPIIMAMADIFEQKRNLHSMPGTLQALLSPVNTRNSQLNLSRPNGKDPLLFLEWDTQEFCYDGTQYQTASGCTYNLCAPGVEQNDKAGVFLDRDMLQCLVETEAPNNPYPQLSIQYEYGASSIHSQVCARNEAEYVGRKISEYMWQYALALNNYLYGVLSGNYTQYTSTTNASDCVPHDNPGAGKGGWFDINGQLQTGIINFLAMNQAGAVFPFFHSDLRKFFMLQGLEDMNPIMVHGLGALFDYAQFRADGAFCCNDAGVDLQAIVNGGQSNLDGFYFLESRPRANNNAGVTQDSVLMWQPGNNRLLFDIDFYGVEGQGAPGTRIQYDYERRTIVDPRTGIPFYFTRELQKCQKYDYNVYNVIPPNFTLISKPTDLDQCPGGSNQTFCLEIQRCQPTDCAGTPTWAPLGDPTTDLDGQSSPT